MSQQTLHTNPDLSELLLLQDNFISLIHVNLYNKSHSSIEDSIFKFQIHYISQANNQFNRMVETLSRQLIDSNIPYELNLRDSFQKLLQADFLPLLRVNRYQLTKLSLFGFDIYVEPLEAILQILSRLDIIKKRIIQAQDLKECNNPEKALQKGWDDYMIFADQWKFSFNIYILGEYLRVGNKSFLKKDREILFTGINHLYSDLVPVLSSKKLFKILRQLAELNNSLYYFHPSFNYFQFYTLLFPLKQDLEPIFFVMNEVVQKCLRTNILTPLLFGLLRHRQMFLDFIKQANSAVWLPYLNTIISGIVINLKFRILQYEQILDVFEQAVCKAGLLGTIRTNQVSDSLQEGWKDAKDFFISAVKIGFNSGQVQTWKNIQFQQIGSRIMSSLTSSMLLNPQQSKDYQKYLFNLEQRLSEEILQISNHKLDWNSIKNSVNQLDTPIENENKVLCLIRIINIIKLLKLQNEYTLHFVIHSILAINYTMGQFVNQRLQQCIESINQSLWQIGEPKLTSLKQRVIQLHCKFRPNKQIQKIIKFYYKNYQPKKALISLIEILPWTSGASCINSLILFITKEFLPPITEKLVKIKTFQRQYLIKNDFVNAPYQFHCILNVLISQVTLKIPLALDIILKIIENRPQMSFALLNFPINQNGRLYSFGTYMIQNHQCHDPLKTILTKSRGMILSEDTVDLITNLSLINISEQLCKRINELEDVAEIFYCANLLLWINKETVLFGSYFKDILHLQLYLFQKNTNLSRTTEIVRDIALLAMLAFKEKVEVWVCWLLIKRIEGKLQPEKIDRKRMLKTSSNSIYFINQSNGEMQLTKQIPIQTELSLKCFQERTPNQIIQLVKFFWNTHKVLSNFNLTELNKIIAKYDVIVQEQIKAYEVPQISEDLLKELFEQSHNAAGLDSDQKLQLLRFAELNTQNYLKIIEIAILTKDTKYLSNCRYISRLNSKFVKLLQLQCETKENILKQMCSQLSVAQKDKIADNFLLDPTYLQQYLSFIQGIQFVTICNNFNWRLILDYIIKEFSQINLASALMQYNQYVTITSQPNGDYQNLISRSGKSFNRYICLLSAKLNYILSSSTSNEQLSIKYNNQITFLNLIMSSLALKEILTKLGILHATMKERSIQYAHSWIGDSLTLNRILNQHFKGSLIVPDFINSYSLTNQEVFNKYNCEIGVILESYYEQVGQQIPQLQIYIPIHQVTSLDERSKALSELNQPQKEKVLKQEYEVILRKLIDQKCINRSQNVWEIDFLRVQTQKEQLFDFFKLGSIYAILEDQLASQASPFIRQLIQRKRLNWQLLKLIKSDVYHLVKSILVESQLTSRSLNFVFQGQELIPKGNELKVNNYNRKTYCNLIAIRTLGKNAWNCGEQFLSGYLSKNLFK